MYVLYALSLSGVYVCMYVVSVVSSSLAFLRRFGSSSGLMRKTLHHKQTASATREHQQRGTNEQALQQDVFACVVLRIAQLLNE